MAIGRTLVTEPCAFWSFLGRILMLRSSIGSWTSSIKMSSPSVYYGGSRFMMVGAQTSEPIHVLTSLPCLFQPSVFDYIYILFWNSIWTIAPVIGIGVFDRILGMLFQAPRRVVSSYNLRGRLSRLDGGTGALSLWSKGNLVRHDVLLYLSSGWLISSKL